ncbi:MAG TPA: response regulator [Anaeromyxobacter sp.]|nr:response regulator [Anaeromyxobacter sp.]
MSDVFEQVWPIFEAETREQAQAIAAGVIDLERPGASDRAGPLLRVAHTMKGSAASVGALDIERAAHAIEDVLALAEDGRGLPPHAVEAVLRAAAAIEGSLCGDARGRIPDLERVVGELEDGGASGGGAGPGGRAPTAAGAPGPADLDALSEDVAALSTSDPAARAARAGRARAAAERLAAGLRGHAAELASRLARSAAELEAGGADVAKAIARAAADLVELRGALAPAPAHEPAEPHRDGGGARRADERSIRVDAARVDAIAADVDQLVVGVSRRERRGRDLQRVEQALREAARLLQRGLAEAGVKEDGLPRSLADGLDRLRSIGADFGRHARELRRESDRERVFAHGLRDALLDLRMVPAQTVLGPLRATVRELAAKLGKEVTLHLSGGEVRLDRRVLEELKAPLMHLVRNALDHGIEAAAARRSAGKPAAATLEIRVEPHKDHVVFTVRDDGAGLAPERLRVAAVQRGIVSAAEAARLTDQEAAQLAFQPGVSTAAEITALSGRGVGLDVVAEAARRLGGAVSVAFEHGRGTAFTLEAPLAIAGSTGFLFRAGGGLGILPADAVERVLLVSPSAIGTVAGQATVEVDGAPVPFSSMAQALGTTGGLTGAGATVALLVASGGRRVALAVDEVLGEQAIVVSSLGRRLASARHIAGAAALDDGRVVAVLQPAHLLGVGRLRQAEKEAPRVRIVVADDSLTTRTTAKSILEIAGFEVLPAADGEEALALARDPGCELVVADIQMPRLDGLALTRRLKGDPRLARVPVVLVTSLDSAEDRAAGLKAGADAYVVKRDVQRGKLLELVRQLLPA